jgi:hypothetical protein
MRLALLLVFVPSIALAQGESSSTDPQAMRDNDCARARRLNKPCVLTIGAEDIEAGVKGPDGVIVDTRGFSKFSSLVRIRKDFIAEILKTANEID